jgi:hypothetical protein
VDYITADELLETMRAALADERQAIQTLDIHGIERASDAKDVILRRLRQVPACERGALLGALDRLQPELRENLILLTHARAYLVEAQDVTGNEATDEAAVDSSVRWRRADDASPTRDPSLVKTGARHASGWSKRTPKTG